MSWLDWAVLGTAALVAISGYVEGFVLGACATLGLLGGAAIGVWGVPKILDHFSPSVTVSFAALVLVVGLAALGRMLGAMVGTRVRNRLSWKPIRFLDALGGAALAAASVLIVAWVLGVAVSGARIPSVTSAVRGSQVLAKVDEVLPSSADRALQSFNDVVNTDLFPRFLDPFVPERIRETQPPDSAIARQQPVRSAYSRIAKVTGVASCSRGLEGSGFVYAPHRVMTNAHVVAGAKTVEIQRPDGSSLTATVVLFDPGRDVAVLSVPRLSAPPLSFSPATAKTGDPALVIGYPENGPFRVRSARVRGQQTAAGTDIYGRNGVDRSIYSVRAVVRAGNSGGPLLAYDGTIYGVVFATASDSPDTGFALTADEVSSDAATGRTATAAVGTGACTPD